MTTPQTRRKQPDEPRETLLSVRVSGAEAGAVDAWATSRGVGRSEAVRRLLAAGLGRRAPRSRDRAPRVDPETARALAELTAPASRELARLGNVTNQVARKLNEGGTVSERRIVELLNGYDDCRDELRRIGGLLSVAIETAAVMDEDEEA